MPRSQTQDGHITVDSDACVVCLVAAGIATSHLVWSVSPLHLTGLLPQKTTTTLPMCGYWALNLPPTALTVVASQLQAAHAPTHIWSQLLLESSYTYSRRLIRTSTFQQLIQLNKLRTSIPTTNTGLRCVTFFFLLFLSFLRFLVLLCYLPLMAASTRAGRAVYTDGWRKQVGTSGVKRVCRLRCVPQKCVFNPWLISFCLAFPAFGLLNFF